MAVNAPNPGTFLAQISQAVVSLRNDFTTLQRLNNYIASMGGETFLEAAAPNGIGLSAPDAATVIAALGNLTNLASSYAGGAPAAQLDYQANSEPLWGGM
jgi:hypothetical protein